MLRRLRARLGALDGNPDVSYTLMLAPLIVGYTLLLLFYLVFTIFLPPLLLRDLNAAALTLSAPYT